MTHSGDCVSNELEAQAGPSRTLLEMSLLEYNRQERDNVGKMQNKKKQVEDREVPDGTEALVPGIHESSSSYTLSTK